MRLPALLLANKADRLPDPAAELRTFLELAGLRYPALAVSASTGLGLGEIGPWLFAHLGILRVYTKAPGRPPDRGRPFTLRRGQTVEDVARLVHKDLAQRAEVRAGMGGVRIRRAARRTGPPRGRRRRRRAAYLSVPDPGTCGASYNCRQKRLRDPGGQPSQSGHMLTVGVPLDDAPLPARLVDPPGTPSALQRAMVLGSGPRAPHRLGGGPDDGAASSNSPTLLRGV